jgi:hypothetical protein
LASGPGAPKTDYFKSDPFDESDRDWAFYYPDEIVRQAVMLYQNSGYAHIPTPEEIMALDPRWLIDINRALRLLRFWNEGVAQISAMASAAGVTLNG